MPSHRAALSVSTRWPPRSMNENCSFCSDSTPRPKAEPRRIASTNSSAPRPTRSASTSTRSPTLISVVRRVNQGAGLRPNIAPAPCVRCRGPPGRTRSTVQARLDPAFGVERPGEPDAGVPAMLDELPAGHACRGVVAREGLLGPQVGLELVRCEAEQVGLAPAPNHFGLDAPHARLVDEAVVVAKARGQVVEVEVDDPVVAAAVPTQLEPVALFGRPFDRHALGVERGGGARADPARRAAGPGRTATSRDRRRPGCCDRVRRSRGRTASTPLLMRAVVAARTQQRRLRGAVLCDRPRCANGPGAQHQATALVAQTERGGVCAAARARWRAGRSGGPSPSASRSLRSAGR